MTGNVRVLLVVLMLCVATAWSQSNTREPHIGYLYPAGGQAGSVIRIAAAGQFLNGATDVYVNGRGVHASVVRYIRPLRNLQKEQRDLLMQRLKEVQQKRLAELPGMRRRRSTVSTRRSAGRTVARPEPPKKPDAATSPEVKLPDHLLLDDLDSKSLRELAHIRSVLFFPRAKTQTNRQLAEMVLIEVRIDADAEPGDRELRLGTKTGLTNPMVFQVGALRETRELEPNDKQAYPELPNLPKDVKAPQPSPLSLPVLLNGQIMPGDVDRFRFRARRGQQLTIEAHARSLIPYLADAVPGWFQATLALYDAGGREVAFADDFRFNPDPVLFYEVPADGEYELQVRDAIYRGREDFVYRIAVSEQPFITEMFPLGGRAGARTVASVSGWNLPKARLTLDTSGGDGAIRHVAWRQGDRFSNAVPYAVDALPECSEVESNDTSGGAQRISLPTIVNGRIGAAGDVDVFRLEGRAGQGIVAEVVGRRLKSPLDSLLRLTDASGRVVASNDDHVLKDNHLHKDVAGWITHHADSYLLAELPADGTYYVELADAQGHGGPAYGYRLRVAVPAGDFALFVTPSSLSVRAGRLVPISVHALRKDGYDGDIDVVLRDPARGFVLQGGRIPAGRDRVRVALKAPAKAPSRPVAVTLEGRARIGGRMIRRTVVAADDVMQAFLYRHLMPAQEFLVAVQANRWGAPPVELAGGEPVRVPSGGSVRAVFKTRNRGLFKGMQLELNDPPKGVTLGKVTIVPAGLAFQVKADAKAVPVGFADNLIVEAFREYTPKAQPGKPAPAKRRSSMGVLAAVPIEIVAR